MALKHLLDPAVRKEFKQQSKFQEIEIEEIQSSPIENNEARKHIYDMRESISIEHTQLQDVDISNH